MRIEFSRSTKFFPKFMGNLDRPEAERFWTILKPLKMGDLIAMSDLNPAKDASIEVQRSNIKIVVEQSGMIFPNYVEVHNLIGEDGKEITIEDIITYPIFVPLVAEIMNELTRVSQPSELDEKNSEAPAA